MSNAFAEIVDAIHEVGQILMQPFGQYVVYPGEVQLRVQHAGAPSGFCHRAAVGDPVEHAHDTIPVSYTHLDVYKRQVL